MHEIVRVTSVTMRSKMLLWSNYLSVLKYTIKIKWLYIRDEVTGILCLVLGSGYKRIYAIKETKYSEIDDQSSHRGRK